MGRCCAVGRASVGLALAAVKRPVGPPRAPTGFQRVIHMFSTTRARIEALERQLAQAYGQLEAQARTIVALNERVERGSTVAIRADLDALTGRVEQLATGLRKELGKLWFLQRRELDEQPQGTGDDAFEAQIALQKQYGGN